MNRLGIITIASMASYLLLVPFLFNDTFAELPFVGIVKAVDETVTSLDVPQDDDELSFACSAGKVYAVELSIFFITSANGDYSNQWTLPSGATGRWTDADLTGSSTSTTRDMTVLFQHNAGVNEENFTYRAFIKMGTTSGTCQYQWAQFNTDAGATTTLAGSSLKVYETTPSTLTIPFTTVVKKIDEIISSTATPQNDDELFFACSANRVYSFELQVFADAPAVSAFATQWSLPTGATGRVSSGQHTSGAQMEPTQDITAEDTQSGSSAERLLTFYGRIEMGSTAGTCNFQWSQDVSDAGNTTVEAGSTLTVYQEGTTV